MKILYLHGLDSAPHADRLEMLSHKYKTQNITAPHLDYRNTRDSVFMELVELAKKEKFDLIVGSSMGGAMAFNIARYVKTRVVLFNPAVSGNSINVDIPEPKKSKFVRGRIILGLADATVDPQETIKYLSKHSAFIMLELIKVKGMPHRIPPNHFKKYC
jgi:predicted esterase YcpF (UPF0227 family)